MPDSLSLSSLQVNTSMPRDCPCHGWCVLASRRRCNFSIRRSSNFLPNIMTLYYIDRPATVSAATSLSSLGQHASADDIMPASLFVFALPSGQTCIICACPWYDLPLWFLPFRRWCNVSIPRPSYFLLHVLYGDLPSVTISAATNLSYSSLRQHTSADVIVFDSLFFISARFWGATYNCCWHHASFVAFALSSGH